MKTNKLDITTFITYATNVNMTQKTESVQTMENTVNNDLDAKKVSMNQVKYFENTAQTIVDAYRSKDMIPSEHAIHHNTMELKNYTLTLENGNYIKVRDIYTNYQYGYFSLGNKKLKKNSKVTYLIWNISPRVICYDATNICKKNCYACKGNANFNSVVVPRANNLVLSSFTNFGDILKEAIELVQNVYNTEIFVRIHESGDFYNSEYTTKVKNALNGIQVPTLIYTKNMEALELFNNMENITTRYSIMDDTTEENKANVINNQLNTFICVDSEQFDNVPNNMKCSGECSKCFKCWNNSLKVIFVKKH